MSKNDKAIRQYQKVVDTKRQELGTKPKPVWRTNKIIDVPGGRININVLRSQQTIVDAAAVLGQTILGYEKAVEMLGGSLPELILGCHPIMDYVKDLQQQLELVKWDDKAKELAALETKLKGLLSEDAKIEDELADIDKLLGS